MKSHALKSPKSKRIKTEVQTPKSVSVNKRSNHKKIIKPQNSNQKDGSFSPCLNEQKRQDEPSQLIKEIRKTFQQKINQLNKKYFNYNQKQFSSLPNLQKSQLFTQLQSQKDFLNRQNQQFFKKQSKEEFPLQDTKVPRQNVTNERFSLNYSKILDIYESCKSQQRLISKKLQNMSRIYQEYQNELDEKFESIMNEIEIIQSKASHFLQQEKQKHLTQCKIQSRVYTFISMVKKVRQLYIKKQGSKRITNNVVNQKGEMVCTFVRQDEMKKVLELNETGLQLIKLVKKIQNDLGEKYQKVNKTVKSIKEFIKSVEVSGLFGQIRVEQNKNNVIIKMQNEIENKIEQKQSLLIQEEKHQNGDGFSLDEGIISLQNLIQPYVQKGQQECCCKHQQEQNEFLQNTLVQKVVQNIVVQKVVENSENNVDQFENKNQQKTIYNKTNQNKVHIRKQIKQNIIDNQKFNIHQVLKESKQKQQKDSKQKYQKINNTNNDKFQIKQVNQNQNNKNNNLNLNQNLTNNQTNLLNENQQIFQSTLKDGQLKSKINHYQTQQIIQQQNQLLQSFSITQLKSIYMQVEQNKNIQQNQQDKQKVSQLQQNQQNSQHYQQSPIQQSKSQHILSPNIKFNPINIKKPSTFIDILTLSKSQNHLQSHLQNCLKEQNLQTSPNPNLSISQLQTTPQKQKQKISNSKKSIKKLNSILKNNIHHNQTLNQIHHHNFISLSYSQNNQSIIKNQTQNQSINKNQSEKQPTFITLSQKSTQRLRTYRKTNPYSLFYSSIQEITKKVSFNPKQPNQNNFKNIQIKDQKNKLNQSYLFKSYKSLQELPVYLKEINEQKTIFNPQPNSLPYSLNLRINEQNSKHQKSNRQVSINHLSSSRNTLKNVCFDNLRKQKLKFDQMKSCILPQKIIQRINN